MSSEEALECCGVPMSVETAPWDWQTIASLVSRCYECGHREPFEEGECDCAVCYCGDPQCPDCGMRS